jgi:hypothetical protein
LKRTTVFPEELFHEPALLDAIIIAAEADDPERCAGAVFSITPQWLWSKASSIDKFMEVLPRLRDSVLRVTGCQPPYNESRWKDWALRNKAVKAAEAHRAAPDRRQRDRRQTSERTQAILDADRKRGSTRPATTKYCASIARDVSIEVPKSVPGRRKALKRIYAVLHRNSNHQWFCDLKRHHAVAAMVRVPVFLFNL